MCGIVGYIGPREAAEFLLVGLHRLEYRGYDSSGVATITPEGQFAVVKTAGPNRPAGGPAGQDSGPRPDRHRPYPLGHARRPERRELPIPISAATARWPWSTTA